MRKRFVAASLAAACAGLLVSSSLVAQRPSGQGGSSTGTALVDVITVTQNSTRLKQAIEALKREHEAKGQSFKQQSERGNQLGEQLKKMRPGTPEYKKLEQDLTKMRADFELAGKFATNDARQREAKIYYAFSRELHDEIARFAQASGVRLVLRHEPTPPQLNDPKQILREMQKLIVYQRGIEVTPTVLEAMNRRAGAATATSRPAASPPPVQR
jgi:Skp family chaperone for outer membrane proteins